MEEEGDEADGEDEGDAEGEAEETTRCRGGTSPGSAY
jgi:hypothetical protein